ncbi:MAG TPA: serine/threonine-protein kinase [Ktedonobacteraceae bacterium]|nr:serine/threonine-protein kinase [Ktedonobacteraceae bacterium]
MVTESNQLLGQTLGTCTLQSLLGRGGMGAVYLAQQSRPRRVVAMKVLMPGLLAETGVQAEFLVRFRREADAIAALDHINIMPIYAYGEQEELAFLVMPHVTGGTLREALEKRGRLPLNEVVPIIEQAAAALDYAHERGIIHRDLKPANILFHADGRVVLADFGLAKILDEAAEHEDTSSVTSMGAIIGTPEYFSPEQSTGNAVDRRTDVYSLGIVLFQMLSGRVPFTGPTAVAIAVKHTVEDPPPLTQLNPSIQRSVEAVVMKALAKKPEQRYASAGEFARALRAAAPHDLISRLPNTNSEGIAGRITPVTLMSNDTILEIPIIPVHEALTVPSPSVPSHNKSKKPPFNRPAPQNKGVEKRSGCQPLWMLLLGSLLAALLVIGGTASFFNFVARKPYITSSSNQYRPTATAPLPTPTHAPTNNLPKALVPVGTLLYGTAMPACDTYSTFWSKSANAYVQCSPSAMELSDTSSTYVAGIFLDKFPNGFGIPNDYVLQVQTNESLTSYDGFGVFFRNQSGVIHQGTFSFLLYPRSQSYPQDRWEANVYNDTTGKKALLYADTTTVRLGSTTTIDIVVHGSTFMFYINGTYQGKASSTLYPTGTIGLATSGGAQIYFKNMAIYALPN